MLVLIAGVVCVGGCGTVPDAYALMQDRRLYWHHYKVVSDQGPLSASQSREIIQRLEARSGKTDILQRHLAFEQAISGSPLVTGNKVTLLENGAATYRAMFAAIEGATHNINLETYIFDGDQIGKEFANALIAKQQQGVQVNIIYDGFGSILTRRSFFNGMRSNGIRLVEFDPINPFAAGFRWAPLHRDHRKLMVVDGSLAITGGINISSVYSSGVISKAKENKNPSVEVLKTWRDTDVEVEGPVVSEYQELFVANWLQQGGAKLKFSDYFPALDAKGDQIVRVLGSVPQEFSTIYVTLISAIRNAESNIYITDAYFAPDSQMLEALEGAARRGVDVRLLFPGHTNEPLIQPAARSHFSELLDAGVKIYLWQGKMLHAKTATIDGVWSTVGSSNLDWWSIARNDEINTVVLSVRFGQEMNASFMRDLQNSEQLDSAAWQQRSVLERIEEAFARSLEPML
ncbi:MAG: phospholipase D-like domain-containing protein [Candidatus Binatus sp.]